MTDHLLLLDASGFIHRSFHAHRPTYRSSDGLPTWAILGFMSMAYAMLIRAEADAPTHACAVFDHPGKNFRHRLFPSYKSNRPTARREELEPQLNYIRHAAQALGLEPVEVAGFEADDTLVTLARMAKAQGIRTTIVSGDKDLLQAVEDGVIEVIDPVPRPRSKADPEMIRRRFLSADVRKKFGVIPSLVPDVQALSGDAVDGIPGIDGIGGEMAGRLIRRFGSLEALLAAAGQSGQSIETPAIKRRLHAHAKDARLYKKLATLRADVPLGIQLDTLKRHPIERDHLKEMLRLLEAGDRFEIMFGGEPGYTMRIKTVPAPLAWWHEQKKGEAATVQASDVPMDPQDGFYKRRLVHRGPWVAGRIWRTPEMDFVTEQETGFDIVRCEVGGKPRHPMRHWDALGRFPITKKEFDHLMGVASWAKAHAPTEPEANPTTPINLQAVKSIPNPRLKGKSHV